MSRSHASSETLIPLAEQLLARTALSRLKKSARDGKGRLFYLFGPAGCGKTAIIREFVTDLENVCLITATEFAAQLAESSDKRELAEFQHRFRAISVLCCEDIHGISGRSQTQQQLLAIVDDLLNHGHDVVVTSTKMPGQLDSYLPKLVNRFRGGTFLSVKSPDSESRALLLRHFAQQTKVTIPREPLALLADSLKVSPRELAGIVKQLAERRSLIKRETIEELLRQDYSSLKITPLRVTKAVASEFSVTISALKSCSRSQGLVLPRQSAMWLCRKLCGTPLIELGNFFNRQHTSVLHAVRRHDERLKVDAGLRSRMTQIELSITRSPSVESGL